MTLESKGLPKAPKVLVIFGRYLRQSISEMIYENDC